MKVFDRVKLIRDRADYAKEGIHKGCVGTVMMGEERHGYVLVFFDGDEYINKDGQQVVKEIDVGVRVEDLDVIQD